MGLFGSDYYDDFVPGKVQALRARVAELEKTQRTPAEEAVIRAALENCRHTRTFAAACDAARAEAAAVDALIAAQPEWAVKP